MTFLADSEYQIVSLHEVASCLQNQKPFPPKTAVLTFDDGFKNFHEQAFPVLKKFGFPAIVFLIAGWCGKENSWPGQLKTIPCFDLLDWKDIKEMVGQGIEFGSHTMNHPNLSQISLAEAEHEIAQSQKTIQEAIGQDVNFFAYPYGAYTPEVKTLVMKRFGGACSVQMDFVTSNSDLYALPRIDMFYFSQNSFFEYLNTPAFPLYVKCRKWLRGLKGQ
jgi:peptidoglycan/xylan/chitin deacetylase (PgdA/CDA1 family)